MNEHTLRALVDAGAIKRSRIVAHGARFHIEFETPTGAVTAWTRRASVKQWSTLDAAARWLRGLGLGTTQLELAQWAPQQKPLNL